MTGNVRRGTILSFDATAWTALVLLDGADTESQMPVGQWVPSAMLAVAAEVAVLVFGVDNTDTDDGVVLGAYGSVSAWNFPAISAAANGALLIGNGTGMVLATLTGTANRVTVANGAGTITLSAPQDLHTAAQVTFDRLMLGSATGAASGQLYSGGAIQLPNASNLRWRNAAGSADLPIVQVNSSNQTVLLSAGGGVRVLAADAVTLLVNIPDAGSLNIATGALQVAGTQVLGTRKTGWTAATNTKTRTTFDTTTVTLAVLAAHVGALLDDLISHGVIGT